MLAQNFKTPADLGITDVEFDALYKVLGILERSEVPHVPVTRALIVRTAAPNGFKRLKWTVVPVWMLLERR